MNKYYKFLLIIVLVIGFSGFTQPDAKMYYESGMSNLNKKDYIQAIGDFTNAISLNPNYADAYYHRAYAKDLLGKKMGFTSTELCFDLVSAMKLGKVEAIGKLEKTCMGECFDLDAAFQEPDVVLCADFSSKVLADLPAGTEKLVNLVKLNFFNNKATTLSDKYGSLTNLISLDLSSNQITTVSPVN